MVDQADRLQQRVVRGIRQAEQQPDLGDRIAEHAHHHDPPGPARGVGGRARPRCAAGADAARRARTASVRCTGWRRTARRRRSPPAARAAADRRRRARSPRSDGRRPGSRAPAAVRGQAAEHQRHAAQQHQRRDAADGWAARSRRSRRAPRRLPPAAGRHSVPGGSGARMGRRTARAQRPLDREADRPAPAPGAMPCPAGRRVPRGRSPSPSARSTAAARCGPCRACATASGRTAGSESPRRPPAPPRRGCSARAGRLRRRPAARRRWPGAAGACGDGLQGL